MAALLVGTGIACWMPWQTRLQILRRGGKGPPNLVLLHGYGSAAEHWLPYTQTIPFPSVGQGEFLARNAG